MKKTVFYIICLITLSACFGSGGGGAQSSTTTQSQQPQTTPQPSPFAIKGIVTSGQFGATYPSSGTAILLSCLGPLSLPPSGPFYGCGMPNEGSILDTTVASDLNGIYIFTEIAGTSAHPNTRIPIPAGYYWRVSAIPCTNGTFTCYPAAFGLPDTLPGYSMQVDFWMR